MKTKLVDKHTMKCDICYNMAQRDYLSETKYWDDLFEGQLKPIKYKLVVK
jgi:hypothetical protein